MSIKYYDKNQSTPSEVFLAGTPQTDLILNSTSKNPIANKTVYNALADKVEVTVTNLINYYDRSQVYTKTEVRELIGAIESMTMEVVNALPSSDISTTTIYLLKQSGSNNYDQYVYINNEWVKIGTTAIDLSGYVSSAQLQVAIADFLTEAQINLLLADKQDKALSSSVTIGAETVGTVEDAIEEVADIVPSNATSSNKLATQADLENVEIDVDSALSSSSENPVQNKVIKSALDDKASQDEVDDIVNVYGAKNLLPTLSGAVTYNGVTYTPQADGSVVVTGTASPSTSLVMLTTTTELPAGDYIVSSGVVLSNPIELVVDDASNNRLATINSGQYRTFSIATATVIHCYIWVYQGTDAQGIRIYPMIRLASISDSTYQPYAMTNRELTDRTLNDEEVDITYTTNMPANSVSAKRNGNMVSVKVFHVSPVQSLGTSTTYGCLGTLPANMRPKSTTNWFKYVMLNQTTFGQLIVEPSGQLNIGFTIGLDGSVKDISTSENIYIEEVFII